jgi:diguanylate cyclase (GGDEF)-like protein/PAS domain S-box-containing protein
VYNHSDAWANPWKWAAIHGGFVLATCAALISHWRLSELHQAERVRAEGHTSESQRVLSMLISNLPGMAYRCANDSDWTSEFVSEGSFELTGYRPEDLMNTSYANIIHPDDRGRLWADTQQAIAERRSFQQEYRIVTADGCERWVLEQGRAVYGLGGEVVALEGFISDISERKRAAEELAQQSQHDPLAGLPNRTLLRQKLQVNDTFGHRYGDQLLQQVAQRLLSTVGESAILARLGGDEFGVLLPGADIDQARALAQRLIDALEASFPLNGHSVALGASVGVALFPEHAADPETLLRYADVAMYVAKRSGGGYQVYAFDQDQHSADRLALSSELRQAIELDQLVLHYQPTVDCAAASERRRSAGALAASTAGLIPPDQFISLAEQSGIINALTHYVLQAAVHQCRVWLDAGIDLTMSVNLSMRNLHDPQLPETISAMLAFEGISAQRLTLEITESTIMADPTRALAVLQELRALGVQMAIDDFGTGYSSMAYLKGLAVDALKIDKSFVQKLATDASDRAIVRSTVELGHNLGLRGVVAEGVEDRLSYEQLAHLGCDLAQGYYLGRPMPAAALEQWLRDAPFGLQHAA